MTKIQIPTAREIMRRQVHTVSEDADLETAIRVLLKKGHSGAPVLDEEGRLVGVLSEHDCVSALALAAAERWPTGHVSDYMTREVESVSPEEDVFRLAARFSEGRHRRLLVIEEERLVGLITRSDLLRTLESLESRVPRKQKTSTYDAIEKRHIKLD